MKDLLSLVQRGACEWGFCTDMRPSAMAVVTGQATDEEDAIYMMIISYIMVAWALEILQQMCIPNVHTRDTELGLLTSIIEMVICCKKCCRMDLQAVKVESAQRWYSLNNGRLKCLKTTFCIILSLCCAVPWGV